MFYSQFILAKKGPLGTIWIAAHLERKLRKNQVADTDIGVSVDSILSPDIPIALRLSSHLLLGVVRIYSRKVNYLFHDCSETLLKVKQAFRSTVVDLPPEESTAPYHSITLPETFDLDDFVLPDAANLNGNFVDHHVSTKEQITLQDTVASTGYTTLQFGLDEKFGDGDASQIGLDLDEELFLDKGLSINNTSATLDPDGKINQMLGPPHVPFTRMDIDDRQEECSEHQVADIPTDMSELVTANSGKSTLPQDPDLDAGIPNMYVYNIQTPDLNEVIFPYEDVGVPSAVLNGMDASHLGNNVLHLDPLDHAEAPSTPGLVEEAIPANVQDVPVLSPQGKISPSNVAEDIMPDNVQFGTECDSTYENGITPPSSQYPNELSNGAAEALQEDCQRLDTLKDETFCDEAISESLASVYKPFGDAKHVMPSSDVSVAVGVLDISSTLQTDKCDPQNPTPCSMDPTVQMDHSLNGNKSTCNSDSSLKPCTSKLCQVAATSIGNLLSGGMDTQPSMMEMPVGDNARNAGELPSLAGQGEGFHSLMEQEVQNMPADLITENQTDFRDKLSKDVSNDTQLGTSYYSAISEYPEPERMLLDTSNNHGLPNDLECDTFEKGSGEPDGTVDRITSLSSKKRCLLERTPDLHEGSSVKSSVAPRSKRKGDHIPDDDDLLASILVGRGAFGLKMKSTPSLPTVSKRARLALKIGAPKRKVLLDDTMVLHADAIRQQLLSTEDIRRTRKKAPCTRSEIWMIQKSFSEDDIFGESVLTGLSAEITSTFDPNEILDSLADAKNSYSDAQKLEIPNSSVLVHKVLCEEMLNPIVSVSEKNEYVAQTSDMRVEIIPQNDGIATSSLVHDDLRSAPVNDELNSLKRDILHCASPNVEAVHHLEKDTSVLVDDTHITKEDNTIMESRNNGIVDGSALTSQDCFVGELHKVNDKAFSSFGNSQAEALADKVTDSTNIAEDANTHIPDYPVDENNPINHVVNEQVVSEAREGELEVSSSNHVVTSSSLPEMETISVSVEHSDLKESSLQRDEDMEDAHHLVSMRDTDDFDDATGTNVTDILIADNEADLDEEANYDLPNPEEMQSLDNSGWSVRTRGVARYLKLLFDDESGFGRKTVEMDRLLAGKTRKEASRMFFETLVLKTKDYVHVEQQHAFEKINIKPRTKLLKSEF